MTVFYNPKQRRAQPWVFVMFVIVPIVITIGIVVVGQKRVQEKVAEEKKLADTDIFEKF